MFYTIAGILGVAFLVATETDIVIIVSFSILWSSLAIADAINDHSKSLKERKRK